MAMASGPKGGDLGSVYGLSRFSLRSNESVCRDPSGRRGDFLVCVEATFDILKSAKLRKVLRVEFWFVPKNMKANPSDFVPYWNQKRSARVFELLQQLQQTMGSVSKPPPKTMTVTPIQLSINYQ